MSLNAAVIEQLDTLQKRGDAGRAPYYKVLEEAKDPYGKLARGVVLQDQMAGRVAYSYAIEVAKRYCRPLGTQDWLDLSIALMKADFAARQVDSNFEDTRSPSLRWNVIRDYHHKAFQDVAKLPPVAWTAWIPLILEGEAGDADLWRRMLTEDFLKVAVSTAGRVASHVALRAGVSTDLAQTVIPLLQHAPPVVTGVKPTQSAFDRCMVRLAPFQMQTAPATPGERIASFYLDCLATSVNLVGDPRAPVSGLYGPDPYGTLGDFARWTLGSPF